MNKKDFLKKHKLRFMNGDAMNLSYVTDGKFRSELIGTMLQNLNKLNYDETSEVVFYYPFGARDKLMLTKTSLQKGEGRELNLAREIYELGRD